MQFKGRTVLVTGGGRNIGRAIALAFARQGADVVVNVGRRVEDAQAVATEVRALGRRALVCVADVTDAAAVEQMGRDAERAFGGVDVLVLNAAIRPEAPIDEMTYAQWRRVLDICLDGAFHCTRAVLPGMRARGWGRIITLGGMTSQRGGLHRAHVAAAKGGLQGFTRALAVELGPTGITANMVAPGSIETTRDNPSVNTARLAAATPAARQGRPEEIAAACLYLASDGAAYVTGQTLNVNGGLVLS